VRQETSARTEMGTLSREARSACGIPPVGQLSGQGVFVLEAMHEPCPECNGGRREETEGDVTMKDRCEPTKWCIGAVLWRPTDITNLLPPTARWPTPWPSTLQRWPSNLTPIRPPPMASTERARACRELTESQTRSSSPLEFDASPATRRRGSAGLQSLSKSSKGIQKSRGAGGGRRAGGAALTMATVGRARPPTTDGGASEPDSAPDSGSALRPPAARRGCGARSRGEQGRG